MWVGEQRTRSGMQTSREKANGILRVIKGGWWKCFDRLAPLQILGLGL